MKNDKLLLTGFLAIIVIFALYQGGILGTIIPIFVGIEGGVTLNTEDPSEWGFVPKFCPTTVTTELLEDTTIVELNGETANKIELTSKNADLVKGCGGSLMNEANSYVKTYCRTNGVDVLVDTMMIDGFSSYGDGASTFSSGLSTCDSIRFDTQIDTRYIKGSHNGRTYLEIDVNWKIHTGDVDDTPDTLTCTKPIDTVLVVDRSGSMFGSKLSDAVAAGNNFVEVLGESAGLVSFGTDVTVDTPITNWETVQTKLSELEPLGRTNLGRGIKEATSLFTGSKNHYMVILSDGAPNMDANGDACIELIPEAPNDCTNYALSQAADAKAKGIKIYVIGLGIAKDTFLEKLLSDISSDGNYFRADSSTALAGIYADLADCLCTDTCADPTVVDYTTLECTADSDCASGERCVNDKCEVEQCISCNDECVINSDCPSGEICVNNQCELISTTCTANYVCGQWRYLSNSCGTRTCSDVNDCPGSNDFTETEICPDPCPTYTTPQCDTVLLDGGVDANGCQLEPTCCDDPWLPLPSDVCDGDAYLQTRCGGLEQQAVGTKTGVECQGADVCTVTEWTGDTSTTCPDEFVTQVSDCGTTKQVAGTKDCSGPVDFTQWDAKWIIIGVIVVLGLVLLFKPK